MTLEFDSLVQAQAGPDVTAGAPSDDQVRLEILRDGLLAILSGNWDQAATALARDPGATTRDAACLNLIGVVCLARGQWSKARRYFGKAMRADPQFGPAEQNMRRFYELNTFGRTNLPIALADKSVVLQIQSLRPRMAEDDVSRLRRTSLWLDGDATMNCVKWNWDWRGYAWAVGTVALATAIGWPLVHTRLQLANANILMLYLLSVLWVATHHSRGAAVLASVLGVAAFDLLFVEPYYTFAVVDEQYIIVFAVMLLTALVIGTLTDRMRKQAEAARQAWERVEAEFLRNTLLSSVSHDLRTPLAAITGAASSILETGDALNPETRLDLLQTVRSEADRMDRLITNLLDMTRMDAGGMVVKKEWLPLAEVIGSTLHHLERRLGAREVKIELPPDMPLVQMDGTLIEQVLANLLDNVIEYTPADTQIEIVGRLSTDEIAVDVADRGPGLPAGTERKVFDKFFRIHSGDSGRGIGLGLAIVRGIVEAQGGKVVAANRPGGGAVFHFTLPRTGTPPQLDSTA